MSMARNGRYLTPIVAFSGAVIAMGCVRTVRPLECGDGGAPYAFCSLNCTRAASGPIVVAANGQVVEDLLITSSQGDAVTVDGKQGVTIRNCEIHHRGGAGIRFNQANGLRIENVVVVHEGAPTAGANPSTSTINISGQYSTDVIIHSVRITRGSDGLRILHCPEARLTGIEGHDFRGPEPAGQCVVLDKCNGAVLEDFSCENPPATSWPQHGVLIYQSSNVTVRRGFLDGNTCASGIGVLFEMSAGQHHGGLVEDVDAIHQGNGCFGAQPGFGVTFRRTRCRDNICVDQGRGRPASGGLSWCAYSESDGIRLEQSSYFALCYQHVWDEAAFVTLELTEDNFIPREAQRIAVCK